MAIRFWQRSAIGSYDLPTLCNPFHKPRLQVKKGYPYFFLPNVIGILYRIWRPVGWVYIIWLSIETMGTHLPETCTGCRRSQGNMGVPQTLGLFNKPPRL